MQRNIESQASDSQDGKEESMGEFSAKARDIQYTLRSSVNELYKNQIINDFIPKNFSNTLKRIQQTKNCNVL